MLALSKISIHKTSKKFQIISYQANLFAAPVNDRVNNLEYLDSWLALFNLSEQSIQQLHGNVQVRTVRGRVESEVGHGRLEGGGGRQPHNQILRARHILETNLIDPRVIVLG